MIYSKKIMVIIYYYKDKRKRMYKQWKPDNKAKKKIKTATNEIVAQRPQITKKYQIGICAKNQGQRR